MKLKETFQSALRRFRLGKPADPGSALQDLADNRQIYLNVDPSRITSEPDTSEKTYSEPWSPPLYNTNYVRTTKYTILTFIPKNLFEQFQRAANIYFLFLIFLQTMPRVGNGLQAALMGTASFCAILVLTMVKDGYEDYNRYISDNELNNRDCKVLSSWNNVNVIKVETTEKKSASRLDDCHSDSDEPLMGPGEAHTLEKLMSSSHRHPMDTEKDWSDALWKDVLVGDIIKLERDEAIPADMLILSTSEEDGICFVETKNLDGETNLKTRQGPKVTCGLKTAYSLKNFTGFLDSEPPGVNLYNYHGTLNILNPQEQDYRISSQVPISIQNLLLRGCIIRNVDFVVGVVVYTGSDSKIILNSGATPSKKSYIEIMMNTQVMINFGILFVMAVLISVLGGIWYEVEDTSFHYFVYGYLTGTKSGVLFSFVGFFSCLILFQNIVPISLYLTVEVVKSVQAYFIHTDIDMYHEPTNTPCVPKAWNLSDDLGQIEYIFSDKTGTLTQNIMELKQCTIGGVIYGRHDSTVTQQPKRTSKNPTSATLSYGNEEEDFSDCSSVSSSSHISGTDPHQVMGEERDRMCNNQYRSGPLSFIDPHLYLDLRNDPSRAKVIRDFFTILAVCHTVLTDNDNHTKQDIVYRAESPDEAALVAAATNAGFTFLTRSQDQLQVDVLGEFQRFKILHILEFNSTRKRMSVIVQFSDSEDVHLFCKGADSIIMERLGTDNDRVKSDTLKHLKTFAETGLRTLCIASRVIPRSEYLAWELDYHTALNRLDDRDSHVMSQCEIIEKNLTLIGGTAIEDKLQDGVPESIALLREAGIKIWVLTGDKIETAVNIGFSSNLLSGDMSLIIIDGESKTQVEQQLLEALSQSLANNRSQNFSLVIDGSSLKYALEDGLKNDLLEIGRQCQTVLCCRVSPLQKAQVVTLVKDGLGSMSLAIGDGANDVSMIQAAHIGVGISGLEGYQAVMASDYAIAQFRYLTKLLLVHGRWCYIRVSRMILCFFYKNLLMTLTNFWFQCFNGPSQTFLFEYALVLLYNLVFTAFPIMILGSFDQDIRSEVALVTPQLYRNGILHKEYNHRRFWLIVLDASYQSLVCFFVPFMMFYTGTFSASGNSTNSLDGFGTAVAACVVVTSNLYVGLWTFNWTFMMFGVIGFSSLVFFAVVLFFSKFLPALGSIDSLLFATLNFWIVLIFSVVACLLPRFIARYIVTVTRPHDYDIIREQVIVFSNYIRRQSRRLRRLRRRAQPTSSRLNLLGRLFSPSKKHDLTGYAFSMEESSPLSRRLQESLLRSHMASTSATPEHAAELAAIMDTPPDVVSPIFKSKPPSSQLALDPMNSSVGSSHLSPTSDAEPYIPKITVTPPTIRRAGRHPPPPGLPTSDDP